MKSRMEVVVVVGLSMFLDAALRMLVVEDDDGVAKRKGCCYQSSLKTKALRMMRSCSGELEFVESIIVRRRSDEIYVRLQIGVEVPRNKHKPC